MLSAPLVALSRMTCAVICAIVASVSAQVVHTIVGGLEPHLLVIGQYSVICPVAPP